MKFYYEIKNLQQFSNKIDNFWTNFWTVKMSCGIVDDIEDILKKDAEELGHDDFNRSSNKSFIIPKSLKKVKQLNSSLPSDENIENIENSNVPGVASIYIKTWGCTHNNSDSEYMAGQLAAYGYKLVGKLRLNLQLN